MDQPAWKVGSGGYAKCRDDIEECDIILWSNLGTMAAPHYSFHAESSGELDEDGCVNSSGISVAWVLAHEFGHVLGLGDMDSGDSECQVSGGGPLMCTRNRRDWYHPAPDDVDGVRAKHGVMARDVKIMRGDITNSAGAITYSADSDILGIQSISEPRISCHNVFPNAPDCIVTTTTNNCNPGFTSCIRLLGTYVNSSGQWEVQRSLLMNNGSRHDVDVAYRWYRALVVRVDSADSRVWWASWYPDSSTVTQDWLRTSCTQNSTCPDNTACPTSGLCDAQTREPPRVAWNEAIDRFVIAFADPQRRLWVSVSTNTTGTSWGTAQQVALPNGVIPFGRFDLVCPQHQTANTQCRIVLSDMANNVNALANRQTRATACRFNVAAAFPYVSGVVCALTSRTAIIANSISDYGNNRPPVSPVGPAWLFSTSRRHPQTDDNSGYIFNSNATDMFTGTDMDVDTKEIPTLFSPGAPASLWGGTSCDWVPYLQRFACAGLGGAEPW
ncbi:MAG: hypothetical protein AB2A00_29900 [Myxococcota bacterium]